jgi:magnesium-transporting ATPase (P-type)
MFVNTIGLKIPLMGMGVNKCIMITGDNPLTAIHVARDVEIVDRDALILDLRENPTHDGGVFTFVIFSQPN